MKPFKNQTIVSRVFAELIRRDDFVTSKQMRETLNESFNRVAAALHHLKLYQAAASLESDGQLWWYATPENDTRLRQVHERSEEKKPRRPRKRKIIQGE